MEGLLAALQRSPAFWLALAAASAAGDFVLGPFVQFPIVYLVPVSLAAWHGGLVWGCALALTLSFTRFGFVVLLWDVPWTFSESIINLTIRVTVLSGFAFLLSRLAGHHARLAREVRVLSGMLPICAFCKDIRRADRGWQPLEEFIAEHSETQFTHGFCPRCARKHYGVEIEDTPAPAEVAVTRRARG